MYTKTVSPELALLIASWILVKFAGPLSSTVHVRAVGLALTNISRLVRGNADNKHKIINKIEMAFFNLTPLSSCHNKLLNVKVQ
jgi:hypothetical protein